MVVGPELVNGASASVLVVVGASLVGGAGASAVAAAVFPLIGMLTSFVLFPMANALALVPWISTGLL